MRPAATSGFSVRRSFGHSIRVLAPDVAMGHPDSIAARAAMARMTEQEVAVPSNERRAVWAIGEAQDVRDAANTLALVADAALADGDVTPAEARRMVTQTRRVLREAQESLLAAEWTDAGERGAVAQLAPSPATEPRWRRYEREIAQEAARIGFALPGAANVVPFPTPQPDEAA